MKYKNAETAKLVGYIWVVGRPFFLLGKVQEVENSIFQIRDKVTEDIHLMKNIGDTKPGQ